MLCLSVKGSLKKLACSFCFHLLCLRIRSALRSLGSLCLTSSHKAFRPSFSASVAFLQFVLKCCHLRTKWSISFSLLPFSLWAVLWLEVTSPNLFLQAWYRMSPIWLSLDSTPPHKDPSSVLVRLVSSDRHASVSLDFGYLGLPLLVGLFVSAFVSVLCDLVATGSWYSRGSSPSTSETSSSVTSLPSATLGPSALWFSTWLSVPLVSPA